SAKTLVFFSSRRRHTRFSRDWSSDVCSSDLFRHLWPGFGVEEVPIRSVTNGVHGPTWSARELGKLLGESEMDSGAGLRGMQPVKSGRASGRERVEAPGEQAAVQIGGRNGQNL